MPLFKKKAQPNPTVTEDPLAQLQPQLDQLLSLLTHADKRQQEMILQLDQLSEQVEDLGDDQRPFLKTIIALVQLLENLHRATLPTPDLQHQVQMLWQGVNSALAKAGISLIDDIDVPVDVARHSTQGTAYHPHVPQGHIIQTLQAGYSYQGQVYQTAQVLTSLGKENQ